MDTGDITLVRPLSEVIPAGLESVNGSHSTMGCSTTLTSIDGLVACFPPSTSFLSDGHVPTIQMNTSNWAAELVTIRRVTYNDLITFYHVLMSFEFGQKVAITTIYLDLLFCPSSRIGAPIISVFGSDSMIFTYTNKANADFLVLFAPILTTCECRMSTVVVRIQEGEVPHSVYHILVYPEDGIDWMHVGEVRFSDEPVERIAPKGEVYCESYRPLPG